MILFKLDQLSSADGKCLFVDGSNVDGDAAFGERGIAELVQLVERCEFPMEQNFDDLQLGRG